MLGFPKPMVPYLVLVLAQASGVPVGAWSSARPAECGVADGGRSANVWERAKAPELRKYCDLVASGSSKLVGGPVAAVEVVKIADEAERTLPGRAAARVLKGRALVQIGRYGDAAVALREARARDERALDDPFALFAWARALARSGHPSEAVDAYRTLLPRASTLTLADRAAASLEAGMLAMAQGSSGIDSAVPIFRQALHDAQDVAQTVAVLALALALDRAGDGEEARELLAERAHGDPRPVLVSPRARDLLGAAGEVESQAMIGLALEATDVGGARASWQRYLELAGKGPWGDHARSHETSPGRRKHAGGIVGGRP